MSSTPVGRRPSYAVVLRVPHARRTFAFALLGRLSYGVVPLSVMLAVTRATGSYAVAGTVMALFGGTSVFLSPARAALIDRYGPRGALVPMTAVYASLLGLLTVLVRRPGVPTLALGAVTAAAGACTPLLGPTMRAVWTRLSRTGHCSSAPTASTGSPRNSSSSRARCWWARARRRRRSPSEPP